MSDLCTDNRFALIAKYKAKLIEATNMETDTLDMAAIDSILFRFWQMGWLDKLDADAVPVRHGHWYDEPNYLGTSKTMYFCSYCGSASWREDPYCWHCGSKMDVSDTDVGKKEEKE